MLLTRGNYIRPVLLLGIVFLAIPGYLVGQAIPESPAQFLYDSIYVTINRDFTADIRYCQRIGFMNSVPDGYTNISIRVNNYITLDDIQVATDLPDGRRVLLDNRDIQTVSDFGPRYYPDSKTKIIPLPLVREKAKTTIEYKLHYNCLLYLPDFFLQHDIPVASTYVIIRSRVPYRYYSAPGDFQTESGGGSLQISASNIPPRLIEENSPASDRYRIFIRPDTIKYNEQIYSLTDWSDVAMFYNQLALPNENPDKLITHLADSLCRDATSMIDTIETLFAYVRDNIRYVSADIGRGDFKPLTPVQVINRKIGDCKDQSTLLISLIRGFGFAAYPALATTNDKPRIIDSLPWPGSFNHVIAAVNTDNGFVFLDPSQQSCCFGKLPVSIRNRPILICRDENSTPKFPQISEDGNTADISLVYRFNRQGEINCHVRMALYRDMAFSFSDPSPELILSKIKESFFPNLPADQFRAAFHFESNSPELISISGDYTDQLQAALSAREVSFKILSPSFEYLKRRFQGADRQTPYVFSFPFRIKETVDLILAEKYHFVGDSTVVDYNECGMQYYIQAYSNQKTCRTYKYFQLAGYALPAECYNRFSDYLPQTTRMISRSMEIIPESRNVEKSSP
jgi:transglutaminase-like putative cysteine protease